MKTEGKCCGLKSRKEARSFTILKEGFLKTKLEVADGRKEMKKVFDRLKERT